METTFAANKDAGDRNWSLAVECDKHRTHRDDRSMGSSGGAGGAQAADRAGSSVRVTFRYHVLHSARRLVRNCVCDNFINTPSQHQIRGCHEEWLRNLVLTTDY